jgi:hypothetical protein
MLTLASAGQHTPVVFAQNARITYHELAVITDERNGNVIGAFERLRLHGKTTHVRSFVSARANHLMNIICA